MKTAHFNHYGSPEVLKISTAAIPKPKEDEILVNIYATAVNSGDVRLRKADPFAVRFMLGLFRPKINVLGSVFSGRVVAVGSKVTRFKLNDEVFGCTNLKFGAYAEYKCFQESESIALKPNLVSHSEAAVIPFGATTALYFLRKAKIEAGQNVLIYGASGAVGTAAVQLAKSMGAEVTGVCSTSNLELVEALGADHVIDYTRSNFLIDAKKYDVIYDTVNVLPVSKAMKQLNKGGRLILGAAGLKQMFTGCLLSLVKPCRVLVGMIKHKQEDIETIAKLINEKKIIPVIDSTFSLEEIAKAHAYVEKGHKKGNVAIAVSH